MRAKTVLTAITTDSAGKTVEALPVFDASSDATDIMGRPIDPVELVEDENGVRIRYVETKAVQDTAGRWIDATPVTGGGYVFTNAEAEALVARFTTPPTNARKGLIDTLVGSIKTAGVWSKLDCLWLTAAADSQAARQNWLGDQYNLTPVSAPSFTPDRGYTPDGATSYLRTGFNPTTAVAPKFVQNSAGFGFWSLTNSTTPSQNMGNASCVILPRSSNNSIVRVNNLGTSTTGTDGLSTDSSGYFAALRSASNSERMRRNTAARLAGTTASSGPQNSEFILAGRNTAAAGITPAFSVLQTAMGFIGGNLTDGESDAFYAAVLTYLQAVGAA